MRIEPNGSGHVIVADRDAFRLGWGQQVWRLIDDRNPEAGLTCCFYSDAAAGPGQVQSLAATITPLQSKWRTELEVVFVDDDGRCVAGLVGKTYENADTPGKAKMPATRNAHGFARGQTFAFRDVAQRGPWQPGDWVVDASGRVWVRASAEDAAAGRPWGNPLARARRGHDGTAAVTVPAGKAAEDRPIRPLTLLLRNGYPAPRR